ncbi:GlxA family transcriptional regulator [Pelagibacterium halotolerans]|uniref:GlxA family transcriptional regulator n=1 Tax=Pelagibacterium halotolerans TaxID=531813 RepID=UPI00384EAD67
MNAPFETKPLRIALLALPETAPAAIYGLYEIFASVGTVWHEMTGEMAETRPVEVRIVAREAVPIATSFGLEITPNAALADVEAPDIVIAADLSLAMTESPRGRWGDEAAWAQAQFARGATVCSICTGSVFVAEAGLLDGIEATTHWSAVRFFADHYPTVKLRPERILCPAGPEHRIVTGGGAGAWTDLAIYLIARFCGPAEAVRIAKIFVLGDRSEGQLPFAAMGKVSGGDDPVLARCREWLADHYAEPNPVARMAALSGLPERTFKRRFKAGTGYTPIDYVQALRVEEAKQILETTDEPTDMVAHMVGYDDPAFFRRLFKRTTGVTPARYRKRFQAIRSLPQGV